MGFQTKGTKKSTHQYSISKEKEDIKKEPREYWTL
jgi:hypothetical protein